MKFNTKTIHAGRKPCQLTGAISTPIYQTSTFVFDDVGEPGEYDYSRTNNPTRKLLRIPWQISRGEWQRFAFPSGMAAVTTVIHLLSAGDHVVCADDIYGGTHRLFSDIMPRFGIEFSFIRLNDEEKLTNAIKTQHKDDLGRSPLNPAFKYHRPRHDLKVGKEHDILTVSDNTLVPTPYFLRPIEHGIDIVLHSTTKYLNGHCDVIGGGVITSTNKLQKMYTSY